MRSSKTGASVLVPARFSGGWASQAGRVFFVPSAWNLLTLQVILPATQVHKSRRKDACPEPAFSSRSIREYGTLRRSSAAKPRSYVSALTACVLSQRSWLRSAANDGARPLPLGAEAKASKAAVHYRDYPNGMRIRHMCKFVISSGGGRSGMVGVPGDGRWHDGARVMRA